MDIDTHIKFPKVEGESTHKDHKGEIDVFSWSWGVSNAANPSGGGMGRGRAMPSDFNFTHRYDKASPVLAANCVKGSHFPEVTLTCRKAGDGQKDFLKITMKEVFITSLQPAGSSGGDLIESVSMSYGSIDFGYKPQDDKGGVGSEVKFGWNVKTTEVT
jgi:type VI secretion system secreted protein Hcp